MKFSLQQIIAFALFTVMQNPASAGAIDESQGSARVEIESSHKSSGIRKNQCSLGFLGTGSPVVVTRVSPLFQGTGLVESDQVIAVNGEAIKGASDLRVALKALDHRDRVTLTIQRQSDTVVIRTSCQDSTPIFKARDEALSKAADGRWDECIKNTYLEELYWGGANSQSAGLRLWCHRSRTAEDPEKWKSKQSSGYLSQIDAHLMYEHAELLLEEMQYVPGGVGQFYGTVAARIRQMGENGHRRLSSQLQSKLVSAVQAL